MSHTGRSHSRYLGILVVTLMCTALVTAGCSESGSAEQLSASSPVSITMQPNAIVVQNKAGTPLSDIKVMLVAFGNKQYSASVGRLENAEGRRVTLSELVDGDRATFNPSFTRPKVVRVQATNATGKSFEVETPWK
jgi:hypothetical protein